MTGTLAPILLLIASAQGQSNEEQMAQCAWREASSTAANLVDRIKFDQRYVFNAEGSPTVGLLMRLRAACDQASKDFPQVSGKPLALLDDTKFLKILKKTRPEQVGKDSFDTPVYRCEIRYTDHKAGEKSAGVVWGYGSDGQGREMQSSYETRGTSFSTAELNSLLSSKGDPSEVMAQIQKIEPLKVASLKAGIESGKPFTIDPVGGVRVCQHIQSDGSYTNA